MKQKIHTYEGEEIRVTYDVKRCIHAAECVHGLPAVFDTDKRPWIQPDQASPTEVAEVIQRCPTGALQFERLDDGPAETPPAENSLTPDPNGALYLCGQLQLVDGEGEVLLEDTRLALCRCGASENKPLCDGSHNRVVFTDPGQLGENQLGEEEAGADKLTIEPLPDGPLLVRGPVEIRSAEGDLVYRGGKGAFCRCGQSQNKPFCDGSHVTAGFKTT